MKKILILILLAISICGCNKEDKYSDFKHYNLKNKDQNRYIYLNKDRIKETYVLADITPKNHESNLTGFFYKVSDDDYILLETLEYNTKDAYNKDYIYYFNNNKLYGIGNGDTPMIFEIELNAEKSQLKEINFKINNTENNFFGPLAIKDIYNNKITISGYIFIDENSENKQFICSLEDYTCDIKNVLE